MGRLDALDAAFRKREKAEDALVLAVTEGDAAAIEAALVTGREVGADAELLEEAEAALNAQAAVKGKSAEAIEEANAALALASEGDDPVAFEEAIANAVAVGVPEETIAEAREALETVKELAQAM